MKKKELKQLIKPLVKECIQEVLLEEGLLSNVVSEVVKGMATAPLVETRAPARTSQVAQTADETRAKIDTYRNDLMEAVGKDAYNGVNLFENTEPLTQHETPKGHAELGAPRDAGVDISSLVGNSSAVWQALK